MNLSISRKHACFKSTPKSFLSDIKRSIMTGVNSFLVEHSGCVVCVFEFCFSGTDRIRVYISLRNLPMHLYRYFFSGVKYVQFIDKKYSFLIFSQNIDCGYTLEPPCQGGSNKYSQSMFWSNNNKNRYTPAYPSFTI